jgi:hypothetical protein
MSPITQIPPVRSVASPLVHSNTNPQTLSVKPILPNQLTGQPTRLWFYCRDAKTGQPLEHLTIVHEKPAHMFMVNQDLSQFQHVHPQLVTPGWFSLEASLLPRDNYRVFLQLTTPQGGAQLHQVAFNTGTPIAAKPALSTIMLPDSQRPKTVDGITYTIHQLPTRTGQMAMFTVDASKNGQPVKQLQPFLGAAAHGVIISADRQQFAHVHPMDVATNGFYASPVMFHTQLEHPGMYKVWVQTQIEGRIRTVDWVFNVPG